MPGAHSTIGLTGRVIRMANALMLEQLLGTGQFASASELAFCIGVQKHLLSDLLTLRTCQCRRLSGDFSSLIEEVNQITQINI